MRKRNKNNVEDKGISYSKKILKTFLVYIIVGSLITLIGLTTVERYIISITSADDILPVNIGKLQTEKSKIINVPSEAKDIQYSFDNTYYAYLHDSKIYINNIDNGEQFDVIQESNPICYFDLLYDKNLIIYFTKITNGSTTKLHLNTYEIRNKRKTDFIDINVQNFSAIKSVEMSPVINMIYVNVEQGKNDYKTNTIYKINLFNSVSTVKSGLSINKMLMLQQTDRVYYEDSKSNIYYSNTSFNIFSEKVKMIGIDANDILYFLSNDNKTVYKVKNNKIQEKISLNNTDIVNTYSNNYCVYIIYDSYVINVSSVNPQTAIGKISKYVTFEAIKDDKMYLRADDTTIIQVEILVDKVVIDAMSDLVQETEEEETQVPVKNNTTDKNDKEDKDDDNGKITNNDENIDNDNDTNTDNKNNNTDNDNKDDNNKDDDKDDKDDGNDEDDDNVHIY